MLTEYKNQPGYQENTRKINKMIVKGKYIPQAGYKELGADGQKLDKKSLTAELAVEEKTKKEKS